MKIVGGICLVIEEIARLNVKPSTLQNAGSDIELKGHGATNIVGMPRAAAKSPSADATTGYL